MRQSAKNPIGIQDFGEAIQGCFLRARAAEWQEEEQ